MQHIPISIPLWFDWKTESLSHGWCCRWDFNSTMVRLEGISRKVDIGFSFHFNSTMVRLEDANFPALLINDSNFNSTMVRLEAVIMIDSKSRSALFQFHYGSIGRVHMFIKILQLAFISIPLWFDWKVGRCSAVSIHKCISIPLWFDWKRRIQNRPGRFSWISIPLWFDWKSNCWKINH